MRAVAVLSLALIAAACGRQPVTPDAFAGLCSPEMPAAPTFGNVQQLFSSTCAACHVAPAQLDLSAGHSYADLVGIQAPSYTDPPTDESCGGLLVSPGNPDASYLYQKLSSAQPCAGLGMPRTEFGTAMLPACEIQLVHDWIAAGAPND